MVKWIILIRLIHSFSSEGKSEPIKLVKIFISPTTHLISLTKTLLHMGHLLPVLQIHSQFWYAVVDSRHWLLICYKILNPQLFSSSVVSDVEVDKTDTSKAMEVVCKFVYFEVVIITCISILTGFFCRFIFC